MIKYINYLILFLLLSIGVLLKDDIHISTNLLSLFASKDATEKLSIADNLGYSKEMLVVVKGLDKSSKKLVKEISKKLEKVKNIASVQSSIMPSKEIQTYYKENYPILAAFNDKNFTKESLNLKLQELYDAQFTNVFYTSIDKNDPLKLFTLTANKNLNSSHKGELLTLGEYGYLIRVRTRVSPSDMNEAKILYKDIRNVLDKYENVSSFAPFYYTVENSKKIQEDVQWIILLSTIVLFIIYYLLIKNLKLLSHTLIALFSSMVFATLVSTLVFTNFSALSLAFGMSITAVSIDYLLHYHFHNFYQTKKKIDKNVLYGYLTTIVAFGIFSFIPIPIIAQISFFAVMSLSFAYILFTFVFPKLDISEYVEEKEVIISKKIVPASFVFALSIGLLIYSALNINLDNNIRNLDYQNTKLHNIQKLITSANTNKLLPVIVEAGSKDKLIDNLHLLHEKQPSSFSLASFIPQYEACLQKSELLKKYDFQNLNKEINIESTKIGFRENYFKDSYSFAQKSFTCRVDNLDIFKSFSLSTYKENDTYYTIALVEELSSAKSFEFVTTISAKEIFSELAVKMYKDLLLFTSIVITVIFILLFISVKQRLLYALNYILFPISVTLAILVSYTDINLMHLFSLIILIAIGIDYGIYMSNTDKPRDTMLAIKYSIFSTFAAFGVLIFSSIVALHSIGIVITIGTTAIFLLIRVMR